MNEVIEAIRALLKSTLGGAYKKYYYGEVHIPNQSFLPFVEVVPMSSRIDNRGTGGMMDNQYTIQVNVKSTLTKYLRENTNTETIEHVKDLVKQIEERDSNGNVLSTTILGVLHDNLQLSNTANINGNWDISYDSLDLGDSYITIAKISFTVRVIST